MKITVTGSLCYDTVILPNGGETRGFGGIFYNLVALSCLASEDTAIFPVFDCGEDRKEELLRALSGLSGVDPSGIRFVDSPTESHVLRYVTPGRREEVHCHLSSPISVDRVVSYLDTDFLLVNFISGFEFTPADMSRMREHCDCPVLIDVHTLSLGIDDEGRRFRRMIGDWRDWIGGGDIVQMNEEELESFQPGLGGDMERLSDEMIASGVDIVIVTMGERGIYLKYSLNNNIQSHVVPAYTQDHTCDVTGCGDTFSAGFIVEYGRWGDPLRAALFGNVAAGIKSRYRGIHNLPPYDEISREILRWRERCGQ